MIKKMMIGRIAQNTYAINISNKYVDMIIHVRN